MTSAAQRKPIAIDPARVITDPGYGEAFTDHLFSIDWSPELGWHNAELKPLDNLSLHPATLGLHYGQVIFEGLKAHRRVDGTVAAFRPEDHARRFQRSARRLAMPELPEEVFTDAIEQLIERDGGMLSEDPTHCLYLRPIMFATDVTLMLRPSNTYRFLLMAFVAAGFFGDDIESVSAWVSHDYVRAFPGGTGNVKVAGNYAGSFAAQRQAQEAGCPQVLWLDAVERRWIEEMGGMNVFFVRGEGPSAEVVTPLLTGTLLPGVTRDTVLALAERLGHTPREERISLAQWKDEVERGVITEVFACGTAAVVTPVKSFHDGGEEWVVGDGTPGPVTRALHGALVDLHHGLSEQPPAWDAHR
ncbi:branched chain amino acid aminotransferase [Streptomyces sp. 1114.5]|uniref:branched-chain amino acid aminotransferase n=1 Tax=unclassified Streptomyces TaxID=2593676 RepID=UPI000BC39D76|nr:MULTISPECIES: branched-chain amino acid aminotransferase [unclassified Streptomyces]RKT19370.1 branched chain amino acid aminotransferase [Streptomyces sp. 1114.5]SOB85566.1 branched chain amino acid aminotransferase apoenzyme [Streptomyces sp. 1331.2]